MAHCTVLIRLAVVLALLICTTAARAQFDYLFYGVGDISHGGFQPSGVERDYRFNSNSLTASFVGANAKYGLEGGWTPGITLETFIRFQDFDTGRNDSDPLLSRRAFASLASSYGTLSAGRLQSFLFESTTRFNALGNSVPFSPAIRHLFASGNLEGVQGDFYWDRALGYTTPATLEGISVNVMVAQGDSERFGDHVGAGVIYSSGLFSAVLAAQRVRVTDGFSDPTNEIAWQLGASYNISGVRLFGLFTETNDKGLDVKGRNLSAGLVLPLGRGFLHSQVGYTQAKGPAVDRRHGSLSLAYLYPFDSVTDIYAIGMDDRVRGQVRGVSGAAGVRWRF